MDPRQVTHGGARPGSLPLSLPGVLAAQCSEPQDMRRSFDALSLVVQQVMGEDPQSGALYVFVGKRPNRAK